MSSYLASARVRLTVLLAALILGTAQQYLPQPDMTTALARSAAQCQALVCR